MERDLCGAGGAIRPDNGRRRGCADHTRRDHFGHAVTFEDGAEHATDQRPCSLMECLEAGRVGWALRARQSYSLEHPAQRSARAT